MDIDILKVKRKSLRAAFTVCCNGTSNRIDTETLGNNEVNALYKQLQDKFSRLETSQEEISDLLLRSDELKNTYQEDFSIAEEYRDKFCQICSLLEASQEKTILVQAENISVEKRKCHRHYSTEDYKRKHAHSDFLNQFKENLSVLPDGRFRLYPIGLSSDIEKAFLQLSIIPEHRDSLRFFLPTVKETKIYRYCRVVLGICSPFQLSACIDHLLENPQPVLTM
ncbi:putative RNA-directed DNA polymerase from transposon X-element [Trichonephila inaurata madagascariensis]|uniref:Putative RNA-directed DNA polymerase from transposon X-element n=1 Tax=Trichonephila inaurata madagascariensis TaxID=2747483 RepID=A0A8X6YZG9_9ARAC|nr:putative RNA-directed DNA polymerase from transposon X-element [Trichonephila inaurata madagascariensis]